MLITMNLEIIFVETIEPEKVTPGKLFISEKYNCCQHICPCGCGTRVAIPFIPGNEKKDNYWGYYKNSDGTISLGPSILNRGCGAHYYIKRNQITDF